MTESKVITIRREGGEPVATAGVGFSRTKDRAEIATAAGISDSAAPVGVKIFFRLVTEVWILDWNSIELLTNSVSSNCKILDLNGQFFLEWNVGGWNDRRLLSEGLVSLIRVNGGVHLRSGDREYLEKFLKKSDPIYAKLVDPVKRYVSDLMTIAYLRLRPLLFFHCTRIEPFQLLPTGSFVRYVTGLRERKDITDCDQSINLEAGECAAYVSRRYSKSEAVQCLLRHSREVLTMKLNAAQKRQWLNKRLEELLPLAVKEGRGPETIFRTTRMLIHDGGASGIKLSAKTISDYLGISAERLSDEISSIEGEEISDADWSAICRRLLTGLTKAQADKLVSFLSVCHDYLVARGMAPVRLARKSYHRPAPEANYFTEQDFKRACEFINRKSVPVDVKRIARAYLYLLYFEAFRTSEPWGLKLEDINVEQGYLIIPFSKASGDGKTNSTRRSKDIESDDFSEILVALKDWRKERGALPWDYLLSTGSNEDRRIRLQSIVIKLCILALRWASGRPDSVLHHLRHTVFSRGFLAVMSKSPRGDAEPLSKLSADGGHSGFGSTVDYVHILEPFIPRGIFSWPEVQKRKQFLPSTICSSKEEYVVQDDDLLSGEPDFICSELDFQEALTPEICHAIISRKIAYPHVSSDEIAVMTQVKPEEVESCFIAFGKACIDARLWPMTSATPGERSRQALFEFSRWHDVAMKPRSRCLGPALTNLAKNFSEIEILWLNWCRCVDQERIDLGETFAAEVVLKFFVAAGVPRDSMAAHITSDSYQIQPEIRGLVGHVMRESKPRTKKREVHLVVADPGRNVCKARHSAGSVAGMQWWFLMAGTYIHSQRGVK